MWGDTEHLVPLFEKILEFSRNVIYYFRRADRKELISSAL
jgi:hypothetical protein